MITTPTTLILGAGASMDFGFPSGWGLIQDICDGFYQNSMTKIERVLVQNASMNPGLVRRFVKELNDAAGCLSVDVFLEHQPELVDVGKAAIAASLIRAEAPHQLHRKDRPPSWYDLLFSVMHAAPSDWSSNALRVVTFNYDRSLEEYLLTSVSAKFGMSRANAADLVRQIPIVHVHGQLGGLPPLAEGRSYAQSEDRANILIAAAGLNVIHESKEVGAAAAQAREHIRTSARVYFVGFGYGAENMALLRLDDSLRNGRTIGGTCYGMSGMRRNEIGARLYGTTTNFGDTQQTIESWLGCIPALDS